MSLDFNQIKELLVEVNNSNLSELTLEYKDLKVILKKNSNLPADGFASLSKHVLPQLESQVLSSSNLANPNRQAVTNLLQSNHSTTDALENQGSVSHIAITSPMVGTFYRAASPTSKPFVQVGDVISSGQTICIIEAMKLMNDMPAEISGKIVKICVDNGTTVEYGQTLFLVDSKG